MTLRSRDNVCILVGEARRTIAGGARRIFSSYFRRILGRTVVTFSFLCMLVGCAGVPPSLPVTAEARWYYPVVKRPWNVDLSTNTAEPTIAIAGGEYELALLSIPERRGGRSHMGGRTLVLDAERVSDAYSLTVYSLPSVFVDRKSRWFDSQEATGPWLDPCVPLTPSTVSSATGEIESTYTIPEGTAYLLLEIHRERETSPERVGDSPAAVDTRRDQVFAIGGTIDGALLPEIRIQPLRFSLPFDHSVPVLAWIGHEEVLNHHRNRGLLPWNEEELWFDYLRILREHRIVPYDPLPSDDFDWTLFEEIAIPLFTGGLTPDGVPAPAVRFRESPFRDESPEDVAYLDRMVRRLTEEGLIDRTIYYVADEPLLGDYTEIVTEAERIQTLAPPLRTLVTEPYTPALAGSIDIWCVDIPFYSIPIPLLPVYGRGTGLYPDFQVTYDVGAYRKEADLGREFWMYTCMSAQFLGYPNLFIDAPGTAHRVIPWLLYVRNGTGMIHYHTTYAYDGGNDPWLNQHFFSANGDGTLLYPARPDIPGVERHGAIASLRLKLLRDGLEDIEYLLLLEGQEATLPSVEAIVRSGLQWERDPNEYIRVRTEIAQSIERISAAWDAER